MERIWVGDFRIKSIQEVVTKLRQQNNKYFFEDSAEYNWFSSIAAKQFVSEISENSAVILMIGFNDCINSCIWSFFDINEIANNYANTINNLINNHKGANFFVCSVNPVDSDFPHSEYKNGVIPAKILNDSIEKFNETIRKACPVAKYIDTYNYLTTTSFNTYDGVRFTLPTAKHLLAFISAHIDDKLSTQLFVPRLNADDAPISGGFSDDTEFWRGENYNGLNPYYDLQNHINEKYAGDTLPNCTAYAWGRFCEILGTIPKLKVDKVDQWYRNTSDGYKRGIEPALGAIMCWSGTSLADTDGNGGYGHVAIVEQINDDGSIITSESSWNSADYWCTKTRVKGTDSRWGQDSSYTFQGFIYCQSIPDISSVTSKDEALSQAEMEANAKYIWHYLGSRGWSLNAVAGMLGNMQHESTINPGRQQVGGSGFGLVRWTPKTNLTDWTSANGYVDDDIDGQLEKIINEKDTGKQYYKNHYKYNFKEFSTSLDSPYTLACAFAFDYKRSAVVIWGASSKSKASLLSEEEKEANREALRQRRGNAAEEWYKFLAPFSVDNINIDKKFTLDGFKVDKIDNNKLTASAIVKCGTSGSYKLISSTGTELIDEPLMLKKDGIQVITFTCPTELKPNTEYKLRLNIYSSLSGETKIKQILVRTPQDYPKLVGDLKLSLVEQSQKFKLNLSSLKTNFGYWKTTKCGYTFKLVINGKTINEIDKDFISDEYILNLNKEFGYTSKMFDSIQIGVQAWVQDNSGVKIFNKDSLKVSNPVYLFTKSVVPYLAI